MDGQCDDGTMTSMRMLPNLLKKATHETQHPAQDAQAKSTQDYSINSTSGSRNSRKVYSRKSRDGNQVTKLKQISLKKPTQ